MNYNVELYLENIDSEESKVRFFFDTGKTDYIGMVFTYQDKEIPLYSNIEDEDEDKNEDKYFYIEKNQVGFLIDFLKRMYDNMDLEQDI